MTDDNIGHIVKGMMVINMILAVVGLAWYYFGW